MAVLVARQKFQNSSSKKSTVELLGCNGREAHKKNGVGMFGRLICILLQVGLLLLLLFFWRTSMRGD